jgi:hypothetical protein
MGNKKITDGAATAAILGTTELEVSDGGITQLKGTASQVGDYIGTVKTYPSLATSANTIDGAINEVNSESVQLDGILGGQNVIGGTGVSDNLTFETTSNATKGYYMFNETDSFAIGELPSAYTAFAGSRDFILAKPSGLCSAVFRCATNQNVVLYFTEDPTVSANMGYVKYDTSGNVLTFGTNGSVAMQLGASGHIYSTITYGNPIAGRNVYVTSAGQFGYLSSSIKHKLNVVDIASTDWLYDVRIVNFEYKKKDSDNNFIEEADGITRSGIIAEELNLIKPDLVYKSDGGNEIDGVDYDQLIPVLIEVVQKQKAMIDALDARIITLEAV